MSVVEPAPPRRWSWWTVIQGSLLALTLVLAARAIALQWSDLNAVAHETHLHWGWIVLSGAITLAVHATLIQSWRILLAGWGSALPFGAAVRIWTISNLGKYLPGKVWSIGAMGILAKREGVSAVSAGGAALLNALLNLGAGFGVIALAGAGELHKIAPWMRLAASLASASFVIGVLLLPKMLPPVLRRLAKWRGLPPLDRDLPAATIWSVTGLHALSWVGYGLAFAAFVRGVAPLATGDPVLLIAVYAASYLWGYLMLFAPGGIGVREFALVAMLVSLGIAGRTDALLIALASRIWLTVLEVLPGLIALFVSPKTSRSPAPVR